MSWRKRGLALTLALLLLSVLPQPAFGAEAEAVQALPEEDGVEETGNIAESDLAGEPETVEAPEAEQEPEVVYLDEDIVYVNPLYRDILDENDLIRQAPQTSARRRMAKAAAPQENHYVTSVEEAGEIVRAGMKRRETIIRLYYRTNEKPVWGEMTRQIIWKAIEHTGVPAEGDYLKWQNGGWSCPKEQNSYIKQGDAYDCTITYVITYYTTAEEEQQVDDRISSLRSELGLSGKSDYEKIKGVYDYITETVTYDWDYAEKQNAGNFHPWSAYAALINHTSVCQGYALLFYRVMLEEGIDCRVIFGYSGGDNHAWNIVKLDGVYYNLDPTQDAGNRSYHWFLKSDEDFPDHERGGQRQGDADHGDVYDDAAFYAAYPMSETSYEVPVQKLDTPQLTDISSDYYGVELSWKSVSGAECYRVWRKNQTGGWERVGETTHTSYLIPGLTVGERYTFTVSCVDQQGESVSDRDEEGLSVLYALISLQTPKLNAAYNINGGVRVTWSPVPEGNRYRVFYRVPGGRWTNAGDANGTSFLVKGLTSGTRYTFTVRCVSDNGACFTSMYDTAGKTLTYLAAPEIKAISAANGKVSLNWGKVTGAAQYRVFYQVDGSGWRKAGDTKAISFTSKNLTMGKTYRFTVRCISSDGKSYTSGYNNGRLIDNVATPHILTVGAGNGKVSLTWGKVAGAAQYRIFYKVGSGKWCKAGDTKATKFTTKSLATGKTYRFTVRCLSADGRSFTSGYDSAGKLIANLATPEIRSISSGSGKVSLSWNKVPGGVKYQVFYRVDGGGWHQTGDTVNTSYTVQGLKKGEYYTFTVRCIAADGKGYTSGYHSGGPRIKVK